MCTENIIVMEFIFSKTMNQMKLTPKNKELIRNGLNDYVQLSFYALFHDMPVTFHGDPHGGNIYMDKKGNIGFLDMGLIFTFSKEEVEFIRKIFLDAYTCNIEELTHILVDGSNQKDLDVTALKQEFTTCCENFKNVSVPEFFMSMIFVYTKHNLEPDPIFYKMAKAFIALFGINTFTENIKTTEELLMKQIIDFYVTRTMTDVKELTNAGIAFLPNFIKNTLEKGLSKSISEQVVAMSEISKKMKKTLNHADEMFGLLQKQKL